MSYVQNHVLKINSYSSKTMLLYCVLNFDQKKFLFLGEEELVFKTRFWTYDMCQVYLEDIIWQALSSRYNQAQKFLNSLK